MGVKVILLVIFFAVMAVVGIYSRRHTKSVDAFVLGGRSVGPWLMCVTVSICTLLSPY